MSGRATRECVLWISCPSYVPRVCRYIHFCRDGVGFLLFLFRIENRRQRRMRSYWIKTNSLSWNWKRRKILTSRYVHTCGLLCFFFSSSIMATLVRWIFCSCADMATQRHMSYSLEYVSPLASVCTFVGTELALI